MIPTAFAHIGFTCKDPFLIENFYIKHFGFKRVRTIPLGNNQQIIFIQSGDLTLEIFAALEERPFPQADKDGQAYPGLRHIAFQVESVEAKLAEMGADAKITLGPFSFDDFIQGWKTVWIADPEGNILEITQGYKNE